MKQRAWMPFAKTLLQIAPYLGDRVDDLKDWDQIKLLSVQLNRLRQWHLPGLLCIGDAAHAMFSGWRSWNQSGNPGRRCDRELAGRRSARATLDGRYSCASSTPPRVPHAV